MSTVLLDTHAWMWSLTDDPRLSARARLAIGQAEAIEVSPVSFFGVAQTVRLGKWPEMDAYVDRLVARLDRQGGRVAVLEPAICLFGGMMNWQPRDPFDRLLAATARHYDRPRIPADPIFDGIVQRTW